MTIEPTRPTHDDEHAFVELLDVLLEEGVVVQADVVVSVATVPLVGIRLEAAVAGLSKMLEYGYFEDWDEAKRRLEAREAEEGRRGPGAYVTAHRPGNAPWLEGGPDQAWTTDDGEDAGEGDGEDAGEGDGEDAGGGESESQTDAETAGRSDAGDGPD